MQPYVSTGYAAAEWGVTTRTVVRMNERGDVPGVIRPGRNFRIPLDIVQRMTREFEQRAASESPAGQ